MENAFEYKGYRGSAEFSAGENVFFGKITVPRDVVTFEGDSLTELKKAFEDAVDDYTNTKDHICDL